ncbi:MAG: DsbC family protein [Gammaproteobacteria bacterium]|jgi:thiol:disulfide interchange protein DsbC|nr:DsbC family protein [Gammaproteobacteria bacterium]
MSRFSVFFGPVSALIVALFAGQATPSLAAGAAAAPAATTKADPRAELVKKMPGSKIENFRPAPIPGMWEFSDGSEVLYLSADGKFAIAGDLYDLASKDNLSEARRRETRLALLAGVPETQMVIFGPKEAKHTVTVFTDVDCTYCRKLHSEIAKYNDLGIRVRYLFYPRSGPDSESWDKAVAVWCSNNRNDALTRAKKGEALKVAKCNPNPVARDYELGQNVGLRGTPAIVLANGDLIAGYVPPAMLAKRLEEAK